MPIIYKTLQAQEDVINIWRYSFKFWGEKQADNYVDELNHAFHLLANEPKICRLRNEIKPPVRIYHLNKHLIIYIEVKGGIQLIRILHESSDYHSHIQDTGTEQS